MKPEDEPLVGEDDDDGGVSIGRAAEHVYIYSTPESPRSDNYRYIVFILLEIAFAVFSWYCFVFPIPLPDIGEGYTLIKGLFTTIFIIWHTIALAFAGGICANSFSREWAAREPRIDTVSTVTQSLIRRASYLFTKRSTNTFRTAFIASIILLVMACTAPATIGISPSVVFQSEILLTAIPDAGIDSDFGTGFAKRKTRRDGSHTKGVSSRPHGLSARSPQPPTPLFGNGTTETPNGVTFNPVYPSNITNIGNFSECMDRIPTFLLLEKIYRVPVGYNYLPNWLIPPPFSDQTTSLHISYETDLVNFQHSCDWRVPSTDITNGFSLDGEKWLLPSEVIGNGEVLNGGHDFSI